MGAPAQETLAFTIRGPITRDDLPGLCDRVCMLLSARDAATVVCDVRRVEPDAVTVDALARLELGARKHGCHVRLRGASRELLDLVRLMGLEAVLGPEVRHQRPAAGGRPPPEPRPLPRRTR